MKSRWGTKRRSWPRHRADKHRQQNVRRVESLQPAGGERQEHREGDGAVPVCCRFSSRGAKVEPVSPSCRRGEGDGGRWVCLHLHSSS